jgi:hypothetical protein
MDVASEQSKYERMHQVPGYSLGPGASYVSKLLPLLEPGDTVIDFGCGNGDAARALMHLGYGVTMIDLVSTGLRPEYAAGAQFIKASLHDLPLNIQAATWGFCADVMEHLPEEWIDPALAGMRKLTRNIFFTISGVPDGWGKHIGEPLHLTVKPVGWWVEKIKGHWRDVARMNRSDVVYELVCRDGMDN